MEVEEDEEKDVGGNDDDDGGQLEQKDDPSSYVAQLRQVFLSCDTSGCGYLRKAELIDLCSQLHLEDQAGLIVDHLLGDQSDAKVDFDDFKDKFVFLLTQSVAENELVVNNNEDIVGIDKEERTFINGTINNKDAKINNFKSPEREVSPRYVWGSKKYGRRSRPEIDTEGLDTNYLLNSDYSDSEEVFLFDSKDDGLPSAVEDDRVSLENLQVDNRSNAHSQQEQRRASWSHQSHYDNLSTTTNPSSPYNNSIHQVPSTITKSRQGAKRRRRMRSSEERSSMDSESNDEQKESCKWTVDVGQQQEFQTTNNSGGNDEEYLQSIWMKLGVGADGFLNKDGLTRVCEHIGMEKMPEELISQLFEKLDVDQDGQISFEEFLHLFRNGEAATPTSANNSPSHNLLPSLDVKSVANDRQRTSGVDQLGTSAAPTSSSSTTNSSASCLKSISNDAGIFHVINSDCIRPGYADPEVIVELWDSLGITSGYALLRHMGLNTNAPVNLLNLTFALEEALQSPRSMSRDTEVCQAATATYNQELKFLRKTIEQMVIEREKLRSDVAEANSRATMMAQEIDDHQIKLETSSQIKISNLEKKYQEQIRRLQDELENERDTFNTQVAINKQNLEEEISSLKETESCLREQLAMAQNENRNLEEEIRELNQRLCEAEKLNQHRQMEAETILAYKAEVTYEEQLRAMSKELEAVRLENKQLKDNNDELTTELENMRQQQLINSNNKDVNITNENYLLTNEEDDVANQQSTGKSQTNGHHRRNGSWLSDYIKDQHVNKRRGSGQQNVSTGKGWEYG